MVEMVIYVLRTCSFNAPLSCLLQFLEWLEVLIRLFCMANHHRHHSQCTLTHTTTCSVTFADVFHSFIYLSNLLMKQSRRRRERMLYRRRWLQLTVPSGLKTAAPRTACRPDSLPSSSPPLPRHLRGKTTSEGKQWSPRQVGLSPRPLESAHREMSRSLSCSNPRLRGRWLCCPDPCGSHCAPRT